MPQPSPTVLVIDNENTISDSLGKLTNELEIQVIHTTSLKEGLSVNGSTCCDVILVRDILPDGATCYAVQNLLDKPMPPELIIYTTQGNAEHAEHALREGAWDYVIDPAPETTLPVLLKRALRYRQSKSKQAREEERDICHGLSGQGIIGSSKAMQTCLNLAAKVSQSDLSVLLTGESGTGKELFATAIHNFSHRSQNSLTIVDCAALPSTLVESILFGHAKGSFTGADKAQQGLIKQADGGTLFLDEIGEMPLDIQKRFLRVLQERKYRPVGGNIEVRSDFRLIAATNRDLHAMVKEGAFREDLFFRLKTFMIELPPLRVRKEDITELAYYYRDSFCKRNKIVKKKFSPDYLMTLSQYDWPGNIRELFHTIERSITDAQGSAVLYPKHLPVAIRISVTRSKLQGMDKTGKNTGPVLLNTDPVPQDSGEMPTLKAVREGAIDDVERKYLERLMAQTGKDIGKCCKIADVSRSRLYDLLKKHQITK